MIGTRRFIWLSMLILWTTASGCVTTPSADEIDRVKRGQAAFVMLRIADDYSGQILSAPGQQGISATAYSLEDVSTHPTLRPARTPDVSAQKRGWICFALEPGAYMLSTAQWTTAKEDSLFEHPGQDRWLIQVPEGTCPSVQYAGTITYQGEPHWNLFGTTHTWSQPRIGIENADEATEIAHRLMPAVRAMTASVPALAYGTAARGPRITRVNFSGQTALSSPNWTERGVSLFTGLGVTTPSARDPMEGLAGSGQGAAAILIGYLLYLPVGASAGALAGGIHGKAIEDDMTALGRQVVDYGLPTRLQNSIVGKIVPTATQQAETGVALDVKVMRVVLRDCMGFKNPFCLEVMLRTTLRNNADKTVLLDAYFTYSSYDIVVRGGAPAPLPSEVLLATRSTPHPLKDWTGPSGKELMNRELDRAFDVLTREIIRRAGYDLDQPP